MFTILEISLFQRWGFIKPYLASGISAVWWGGKNYFCTLLPIHQHHA
jgi:hypothetical protein